MEGINEKIIENYMHDAGDIEFTRTTDRSMVAKMNNSVKEIGYEWEYLDESSLVQRYISIMTGRFTQSLPNGDSFYPIEKMKDCLGICYGKSQQVLDVSLYQLNIKIDIEGYDIWRRVLVPSTFSFRFLHNIIQIVFDWKNYHLHVFDVIQNDKRIKTIIMDDDPENFKWLDFDSYEILQERFVALEDIFVEYTKVLYVYDFGDSWNHIITLEKTIKSDEFRAFYLEGGGQRPPEDVGGSGGYERYMQIMADEKDPEYESMKEWARSQKERDISPKDMNRRLKRVFNRYYYSSNYY